MYIQDMCLQETRGCKKQEQWSYYGHTRIGTETNLKFQLVHCYSFGLLQKKSRFRRLLPDFLRYSLLHRGFSSASMTDKVSAELSRTRLREKPAAAGDRCSICVSNCFDEHSVNYICCFIVFSKLCMSLLQPCG